ncbi:hypothetical protein J0H58_09680 [bacterium]|nr:hypothetical protein [bacterium]
MPRKPKPRLVLTNFDVFPLPHRPDGPPGVADHGYAWADPVELLRWVGRANEAALALSAGFREIRKQAPRLPFRIADVAPALDLRDVQTAASRLFHLLNDAMPDEWNAAVCDHEEASGRPHFSLPAPKTPAMSKPITSARLRLFPAAARGGVL